MPELANNNRIYPSISIILPVRNEGKYFKHALNSVFTQDYPHHHIEILIVDGMSTDNTRNIIEEYQKFYDRVHILDNPGLIVPKGMNIALCRAKGDIIIRVDGHCVIAPDYVKNCVKHLMATGIDGVGGPMRTIGEDSISATIALAMSSPFGVGNSAFRIPFKKTMLVDTIPFPAYTRKIIKQAGFYDEELIRNQDDEYNYRIRELGGKLLLAEDVRSKYHSRGSFRKLWWQYFQYGYYKVRVLQKHPRQMSFRQFIPPLFVLGLLASLTLTILSYRGWVVSLSVVGAYMTANLFASIITAAQKGWNHLSRLPFSYVIIHLSYGSGFLVGLFRFWNRWKDREGKVPIGKID